MGITMMQTRNINELAKEVLTIEANSILRLKNNIGEEFDKSKSFSIAKDA